MIKEKPLTFMFCIYLYLQKTSTPDPIEPTEEVVFSGAGSGCWDDEDDCEAANNEKRNN